MKPKDDLSLELLNTLFEIDEPSGTLRWKEGSGKGRPYGKKVGTIRNGYLTVIINAKQYAVHRIVWFMRHGRWPNGDIDHFGDKDDNSVGKIREATRAQNIQRAKTRATTGVRGVSFDKRIGKFVAWTAHKRRSKYLGIFDKIEDAAKAYNASVIKTYGPLAQTHNVENMPYNCGRR